MRSGIAIAGSILVDSINEIRVYPELGELTKIISVQKSVGGCVPNVAIDLKRICPSLSVLASGMVGDDENGEYVRRILSDNGVDTAHVMCCDDKTSFTEVMSLSGGQRTFFTYSGASARFGANDVPLCDMEVKMLHLGYFLLLNRMDNGDGELLLRAASERGIRTSIDLVSESSDRYKLVLPCLKHVDNLIINETEAGKLCGIEPKCDNLPLIAKTLKDMGVRERVIIHTPELGLCYSDELTVLPSYELPDGYIKGTTGAGDAFCAGALWAIHEDKTDMEILEAASTAAACSLRVADATGGLKEYNAMREDCKGFDRRKIC